MVMHLESFRTQEHDARLSEKVLRFLLLRGPQDWVLGVCIIIWAPNTDSKVHDRLWVAVAALILGALCDEGQGPCVDLLRVVGVLPVGLSLVTFPG